MPFPCTCKPCLDDPVPSIHTHHPSPLAMRTEGLSRSGVCWSPSLMDLHCIAALPTATQHALEACSLRHQHRAARASTRGLPDTSVFALAPFMPPAQLRTCAGPSAHQIEQQQAEAASDQPQASAPQEPRDADEAQYDPYQPLDPHDAGPYPTAPYRRMKRRPKKYGPQFGHVNQSITQPTNQSTTPAQHFDGCVHSYCV